MRRVCTAFAIDADDLTFSRCFKASWVATKLSDSRRSERLFFKPSGQTEQIFFWRFLFVLVAQAELPSIY
jgi:hypothetical protein